MRLAHRMENITQDRIATSKSISGQFFNEIISARGFSVLGGGIGKRVWHRIPDGHVITDFCPLSIIILPFDHSETLY